MQRGQIRKYTVENTRGDTWMEHGDDVFEIQSKSKRNRREREREREHLLNCKGKRVWMISWFGKCFAAWIDRSRLDFIIHELHFSQPRLSRDISCSLLYRFAPLPMTRVTKHFSKLLSHECHYSRDISCDFDMGIVLLFFPFSFVTALVRFMASVSREVYWRRFEKVEVIFSIYTGCLSSFMI